MNAANAVCVGGRIFHGSPVTMINHGFYNISPTLYKDFYTQNNWTLEFMFGANKKGSFEIGFNRMVVPPESSVFFMARRITNDALVFPMQSKYLMNPDLKAG